MTIADFLYDCVDSGMLQLEIYDFDSESLVFEGYGDEIPDDLYYAELSSWDIPTKPYHMTLNVDLGE